MNRPRTWQWDDLRFFLAVARTGSLSAASRALGVGHVTVGRRIALLEEFLEHDRPVSNAVWQRLLSQA
jgi:hypothetical protein